MSLYLFFFFRCTFGSLTDRYLTDNIINYRDEKDIMTAGVFFQKDDLGKLTEK